MSAGKIKRHVDRIAYEPAEAAYSMGMGLTFFKEEVAPEIRVIRRRGKRLYLKRDLDQWGEANAERVIDGR